MHQNGKTVTYGTAKVNKRIDEYCTVLLLLFFFFLLYTCNSQWSIKKINFITLTGSYAYVLFARVVNAISFHLITKNYSQHHHSFITMYSQLCLTRSRIIRILPRSKVYTKHLSFILYCFLPRISRFFSKSKLFLQSQEIRLRQS